MTTRQRILALLRDRQTITGPEASAALGLTRADVRYHLHALEAEGQIARDSMEEGERRGRPRQVYRLVERDAPEAVAALCRALLSLHPPDAQALAALVEHLAGELPAARTPAQRLNAAVARLNALGYHARWEAAPDGPRIVLRARPFAMLAQAFPALNMLDQLLVERLAGRSARLSGQRSGKVAVFSL